MLSVMEWKAVKKSMIGKGVWVKYSDSLHNDILVKLPIVFSIVYSYGIQYKRAVQVCSLESIGEEDFHPKICLFGNRIVLALLTLRNNKYGRSSVNQVYVTL